MNCEEKLTKCKEDGQIWNEKRSIFEHFYGIMWPLNEVFFKIQEETYMKNPVVTIEMENGDIMKAELYPEIAPNTVNNFISLIIKIQFLQKKNL